LDHIRKMDKELIEHISTQLQHHEESYSPGAWERFSEKENKRSRFVLWPLWVAAALILVFGGTFFISNYQTSKKNQLVTKPKSVEKNINENDLNVNVKTAPLTSKNQPVELIVKIKDFNYSSNIDQKTIKQPLGDAGISNIDLVGVTKLNTLNNSINAIPIIVQSERKFEIAKENKNEKLVKKPTFEDLLAHDSKVNEIKHAKNDKKYSKWEPGVYVAPAMGNDNKVNMNYGFSLSYNIADKLSVSSGIAYSSLSSTSNPQAQISAASDAVSSAIPSAAATYSSSSRNLESVNASVRGINIPLELKYNISKKFYSGVGVSALAVLNNRQDKNYLVSSGKNVTVANSAGVAEQKMLIVTERVSEPQTQSSSMPDKYIGFYNFSLGYKQKISNKSDFAIEPFLRVPMKTFSTDNLNLTNGGIRLKIDF